MKKFLLVFVLAVVFLAGAVLAQGFRLAEAKIYSGESALSSGVGAIGTMANAHGDLLSLEVNATLGQVVLMKKHGSFFCGPTFGQQNNAMWVAPIAVFSPWKFLSFTSWNGIFFGRPQHPGWDINFGFGYQAVDVSVGKLGLGYSLLHYLREKPMNLPYMKYSIPAGPAVIEVSSTYNIRDNAPMFLVAGSYKIK
ncbi:MAG TPA: hypothetical protein PKZ16_01655 [bacterium]|nr:hypothetical protein [bacterium]HPL95535.1 hypothetical protein [bacterium]